MASVSGVEQRRKNRQRNLFAEKRLPIAIADALAPAFLAALFPLDHRSRRFTTPPDA